MNAPPRTTDTAGTTRNTHVIYMLGDVELLRLHGHDLPVTPPGTSIQLYRREAGVGPATYVVTEVNDVSNAGDGSKITYWRADVREE